MNEDAYWADDELGLWMVADGIGGHLAGEVASSTTVEVVAGQVRDALARQPSGHGLSKERACRVIESAVQAATYMVFGMAEMDANADGMGTTLSVLFYVGEGCAVVGQVGDSRVYRVRDGVTEQLTEDHTLARWQLSQGLIGEAEAKRSKAKNVIMRAVGSHDYVDVDTHVFDVQAGDRFLLCSDGLHGAVPDAHLLEAMTLSGGEAVQRMIDMANERGGRDNITAVVVHAVES